MAKLPTEEELEKLYHKKGHDALVWYAWRNALRALPVLGQTSLQNIWKDDVVRHIYAVCRILIILRNPTQANVKAVCKESYVPTYVNVAISDVAVAFRSLQVDRNTAIACAVKAIVWAAAVSKVIYSDVNSAIRAAMKSSEESEMVITDYSAINASRTDYLWCFKSSDSGKFFSSSPSLWENNEPDCFYQWKQNLTQQLQQYELMALSEDVASLWDRKTVINRASIYQLNFSEIITQDANLLSRAIKGEAVDNIHAARVLFLGSGGAGKSSLAERLQGKNLKKFRDMDMGIFVNYHKYKPLVLSNVFPDFELNDENLDLFLWDFDGQTIFHGIHGAFLHENCVYVLVVDGRHEQAPDEWLYQIRHLVGSKAKVLLVTNLYGIYEVKQNETRLLRKFPDLLEWNSFFYFSCIRNDEPEFKNFVQALVKTGLDSQRMVFKETIKIKSALDEKYKDEIFLHERVIKDVIVREVDNHQPADIALTQLLQLGFLVKIGRGKTRYCIKPAWIINKIYQILYSEKLRISNGIQCFSDLVSVFEDKNDINEDYLEYLMVFLQEGNLCHQLATENGNYFFPDASNMNDPEIVGELLAKEKKLILRFDLPYLPLGFHARLVHHLFLSSCGVSINNPKEIWRQGFILRSKNNYAVAVVHYFLRKNIIEMVLTGELQNFAELLRVFYTYLKAVVISPSGIKARHIHPSVLHNQQLFSVHSSENLIAVLRQIDSYDQLFQEVRKMASTGNINVTNGQVIIGDHNTQKSHSDNTTITVTADQRQIISSVLDEMLRHKANLSDDVLEAVYDVRKEVKADEKQPTEKSQSVLGKLWGGIRELTNVAKDMTDVGGFVVEHQAAIGTAVTAAAALLS